jgi:hypothetical protein
MRVFVKDGRVADGLCCLDIRLAKDSLDQICITNMDNYIDNDNTGKEIEYLVDITGMVYDVISRNGRYAYKATLTTDENLSLLKTKIASGEYPWAIWCLICPSLITDSTVMDSRGFRMYPLYEEGAFTSADRTFFPLKSDKDVISIGYFPRVICDEDDELFRRTFIEASRMIRDNQKTSIAVSINRQQQVIIPETKFKHREFDNINANNTRNYTHTITRSSLDYVNLYVAQMIAFSHLGITFEDAFLNAVQYAICNANPYNAANARLSRPYDRHNMSQFEGGQQATTAWYDWTKSLFFGSQHLSKISAQTNSPYYSLGHMDHGTGHLTFHRKDIMDYFETLISQTSLSKPKIKGFEVYAAEAEDGKDGTDDKNARGSGLEGLWPRMEGDDHKSTPILIIKEFKRNWDRQTVTSKPTAVFTWLKTANNNTRASLDADTAKSEWQDKIDSTEAKLAFASGLQEIAQSNALQLDKFMNTHINKIITALVSFHGACSKDDFKTAVEELFIIYRDVQNEITNFKDNNRGFAGMYVQTRSVNWQSASVLKMRKSLRTFILLGLRIRHNTDTLTIETAKSLVVTKNNDTTSSNTEKNATNTNEDNAKQDTEDAPAIDEEPIQQDEFNKIVKVR